MCQNTVDNRETKTLRSSKKLNTQNKKVKDSLQGNHNLTLSLKKKKRKP